MGCGETSRTRQPPSSPPASPTTSTCKILGSLLTYSSTSAWLALCEQAGPLCLPRLSERTGSPLCSCCGQHFTVGVSSDVSQSERLCCLRVASGFGCLLKAQPSTRSSSAVQPTRARMHVHFLREPFSDFPPKPVEWRVANGKKSTRSSSGTHH